MEFWSTDAMLSPDLSGYNCLSGRNPAPRRLCPLRYANVASLVTQSPTEYHEVSQSKISSVKLRVPTL